VVATPGRLVDLIERKAARLENVERVVLDEADEMLNMGFKDSLDFILGAVEARESIWLFSATMPDEVRRIASEYMEAPLELSTGKRNQTNENIEHLYFICRADDRYAALKRVVDAHPGIYSLIFCRTKVETQEVAEQMIRDGYNADALHGDLAQADRDRVMQRFREANLQLLIATDVAARGLDISDISHVINYGLPDEPEAYTHRSGRTGRAGRTGVSISIITPKYEEKLRMIERKTKASFKKMPIPTGFEVCEKQLFHIIEGIHKQEVHNSEIEPFMARIEEELKDLSKEELIKRFASVEFNRFLAYYRNAPDINIYPKNERKAEKRIVASGGRMARLFVNVGEMDGVSKKDFIKLLQRAFTIPPQCIGTVDLKKSYTHFDVDPAFVEAIRRGLPDFSLNGRRIRVDDASPRMEKSQKDEKVFAKWDKAPGKKKRKY
jgi:ATP-dependent RNA helicase DeaD